MKKLLAIVLGLAVAGAAFARGTGDSGAQAGAALPTSVLLTDQSGIDDRSFNQAAWRGMLEFYGDTWANQAGRGRLYQTITAATTDMYIPNLNTAADEGFDLIIANGFTWADAVSTVAGQRSNQRFLMVDVDWVDRPNVMQAIFAEHEGSFLVGAAAALQALEAGVQNPSFGFIGGIAGSVITRFHVGFIQGVHSVIPGAEVREFYVNSWGEPALALIQARNWYNDGVFAIFSAAGASGNGTIAAAREAREAGRNVWAIGVDSDQFDEGRYPTAASPDSAVLTSMVKQVEAAVVYALNAVRGGTFSGRTVRLGLQDNAVGFSTTNPALSQATANRVNALRQEIISGQRTVRGTLAEARLLPGFPNLVQAIDG